MSTVKWKTYSVQNEKEIRGFFGDYRYLSNFHRCPVYFEGVLYPSSESAYMAAKSLDPIIRSRFVDLEPKDARSLGQKIKIREDWESVKIDVMSSILFDKFWRNKGIRQKLIDTEESYLEETNHWNDRFWGCNEEGEGLNMLGKILMNLRIYFQKHESIILKKDKIVNNFLF